jgi:hypothetical protein
MNPKVSAHPTDPSAGMGWVPAHMHGLSDAAIS